MKYAPVMVLAVFFASLALGGVIDTLYRLGDGGIRLIINKTKTRKDG